MADVKFLDKDGLLYYHNKLQNEFDEKVDKDFGIEHGGKVLAVDAVTGLVVTKNIDDVSSVVDVKVDGTSVVDSEKIAQIDLETPLGLKQDKLNESQIAVVNANPYTTDELNKLAGIEAGAQVNTIASISRNGEPLIPDIDKNVDVEVPTHLSELSSDGFTYVESITAGSENVIIGGTAKNPTITVSAIDMPNEFTSTEEVNGAIGAVIEGLDVQALTGIIDETEPKPMDIVIFANNVQGIIKEINGDLYDVVISRTPADVSFAGIVGNPLDNGDLADLFNSKQDNLNSTQMAAVDSGINNTLVMKLQNIEAGAQVNVIEQVSLNNVNATIENRVAKLTIDAVSTSVMNAALETKLDIHAGVENAGLYLQVNAAGNITFSSITSITNSEIDALFE